MKSVFQVDFIFILRDKTSNYFLINKENAKVLEQYRFNDDKNSIVRSKLGFIVV